MTGMSLLTVFIFSTFFQPSYGQGLIDPREQRVLEITKDAQYIPRLDREIALHFINKLSLEDAFIDDLVQMRETECDTYREACVNPTAWAKLTCRLKINGVFPGQVLISKLWGTAIKRVHTQEEMAKLWDQLKKCSHSPSESQRMIVLEAYSRIKDDPRFASTEKEMRTWRSKNLNPPPPPSGKNLTEVEWWLGEVSKARDGKSASMERLEPLLESGQFLITKVKLSSLTDKYVFDWLYHMMASLADVGRAREAVDLLGRQDPAYLSQISKGQHLGLTWEYCLATHLLNEGKKCPEFIEKVHKDVKEDEFERMRSLTDMVMGDLKSADDRITKMLSASRTMSRDIYLQNAHIHYYMGKYDEAMKELATAQSMAPRRDGAIAQIYSLLSPSLLKIKILTRKGQLKEAESELNALRSSLRQLVSGPFWGFAAAEFEGLVLALYGKNEGKIQSAVQALKDSALTPDGKYYYLPVAKVVEEKLKGEDLTEAMKELDATRGANYTHTMDLRAALKN